MQKFPEEWSLLAKINFLQRKIILNSILYYEYDTNSLEDHYYDSLCEQLVTLQCEYAEYGDIKNDTMLGYVYYDFNGSTGFHLYSRLTVEDKIHLLNITREHLKGKGRG